MRVGFGSEACVDRFGRESRGRHGDRRRSWCARMNAMLLRCWFGERLISQGKVNMR